MAMRDCTKRLPFTAVLMLWGASSVMAQSLLWREAHVIFFGSELSLGIALAAWLAGVAAGGLTGASALKRLRLDAAAGFAGALVALGVTSIASVATLRLCRGWLDLQVGEYIPVEWMVLLAMLLIAPASFWVGFGFAAAASMQRAISRREGAVSIGTVYMFESLGSLIGGVVFTFVLVGRIGSMPCLTGVASLLHFAAATCLLIAPGRKRLTRPAAAGLGIAGLALMVCVAGPARSLESMTITRRWQTFADGLRLLEWRDSRYQHLAVGELEGQYSLYANGQKLTDFPKRYGYTKIFAHLIMAQHPMPQQILLIDGGIEGTLAEILLHKSVRSVDYVEIDPALTEMLKRHLAGPDETALKDPRVRIHHVDPRRFLASADHQYDLILAFLPEPTSIIAARLYTAEFYKSVSRALKDNGVFVFRTTASPGTLRPEARAYLASVFRTLKSVFADVLVEWGQQPHIYCAKQAGILSLDPEVLARRLRDQGVSPDLFPAEALIGTTDALEPTKVARRLKELESADAPVSTDERPLCMLLRLLLWHEQQGRHTFMAALLRIRPAGLAYAIIACTALAGIVGWLVGRGGALRKASLIWAVATTGTATMAGELALLFVYQTTLGYIYERIALAVAIFMLGLVAGSGCANRLVAGLPARTNWIAGLILLDLTMAALAVATAHALSLLQMTAAAPDWLAEGVIYALILCFGLAGGAMFPVAGRVYIDREGSTASAAGTLEFADHAGAAFGAVAMGVVLLPALGIAASCYAIALMKALSALLLAASIVAGVSTRRTA